MHPHESRGHYTRYDIDRISLLQQALSHGLPADPAQAKQLVLQRFQVMDAALSHRLENAGKGLAQAMAYGIDRTPAVVFDGRAVIYGVTESTKPWRSTTDGGNEAVADADVVLSRLLALLLLLPVTGMSGTISTAGIVSQTTTAALSCMRWMPVGVCFWLRCSLTECTVETSLKVGHYQPDAVVSSYNDTGGEPLGGDSRNPGTGAETAATGLLGSLLSIPMDSAGNRTEGSRSRRDHRNLVFGKPMWSATHWVRLAGIVAGTGYVCESQTRSFFPYFQSGVDALSWRLGVPEMFYPASLIPGLREIGTGPCRPGVGSTRARAGPHRQKNPRRRRSMRNGQGTSPPAPGSRTFIYPSVALPAPTRECGRPARWWKAIRPPVNGRCYSRKPNRPARCSGPMTWPAPAAGGEGGWILRVTTPGPSGDPIPAARRKGSCFFSILTGSTTPHEHTRID